MAASMLRGMLRSKSSDRAIAARFDTDSLTPPGAVRAIWLQEALAADPVRHPRLDGSTTAEVCIVGGGFTGLWTAIELKRRSPSTDVVLIEGDICGAGASGRNGGFAMTWWSKFPTLERLCGTEAALKLARRSARAVEDIGQFCDEHDIDAHFRRGGWLWTATNRQQVDAWRATLDAIEAAGASAFESLTREEVAKRSGSPVHLAGVLDPATATVQPALLARGMAGVARKLGVRIYEQTPMRELRGSQVPCVVTPWGDVTAAHVVLAINAWMAQIPQIASALVVIASDVIVTQPIRERLDELGWDEGLAVSDSRRLINYYRRSRDGRVVFGKGGGTLAMGGRIGPQFQRASARAQEVESQFRYIYPSLWDVGIDSSWRGPIDYSVNGLPFFCRLDGQPNILVGAGFSGNGVGPSRLAGEVLAEMVSDGGDAGLPHALTRLPDKRLPPEPLRYVGGLAVRAAIARKESAEDLGRAAGPITRALANLDPTSFVDRGRNGGTSSVAGSVAPAASSNHVPAHLRVDHGRTDGAMDNAAVAADAGRQR